MQTGFGACREVADKFGVLVRALSARHGVLLAMWGKEVCRVTAVVGVTKAQCKV